MEQATDDTAPDSTAVRTVNSLRRDTYADSVALMRAARHLGDLPGVAAASLVMATEANLRLLADAHLLTSEAAEAGPNDLIVALRGDPEALTLALAAVDDLLAQPDSPASSGTREAPPARALTEADPATSLALISTPGPYAAAEALKALRCGMHAFVFSDNVPLDQEIRIKQEAHRAGLLAMGPDCGTAVVDGVPLGFANVLRPGRIGLIGASGTGLQQVSCLLDAYGEGIRQMIGTGGRDLSADVGGITTLDAFALLDADPGCALIVLVSKPPAPEVAERVLARAARASKPVVVCFLDCTRARPSGRVTVAGTLRDTAAAAVEALGGKVPEAFVPPRQPEPSGPQLPAPSTHLLRALYAGGTFAYEARRAVPGAVTTTEPAAGGIRLPDRHLILDLGDDAYTAGRPHPMIDPTVRAAHLRVALADPRTAVIVLDVVLGHGAGADPAAALAEELERVPARQRPPVVAFVVGTGADPQGRAAQEDRLRAAGALLAPTSTDAIAYAAALLPTPGHDRAEALTTAGGTV
ncbi:transcriptional regulator [Streptomyces indicus]|uniref:Succinyl-CoA synthetase, alpha subunit n=1 Tax=Streptomyces indicus TaxID=417292 RepID=A0A1G9A8L7_9ACTN|nr:transcriptional regulator [Streptomyces indicus]SDK23601.1 Succinyl-CoA synthetase, alpha subunit [Streptomyces indicus]